ncbi:DNA-binding protein [Planctomycetales bacterium]|nr:DNA-binding protein [Planctomycetales bacterium]
MAKATEAKKALTKKEIIDSIAEKTGVTKADTTAVIDTLGELIKTSVSKKGAGEFSLPGILKVSKQHVKAKPAQKNVKNPLTGIVSDRPAKPAHDRVKIKPLKALKDSI